MFGTNKSKHGLYVNPQAYPLRPKRFFRFFSITLRGISESALSIASRFSFIFFSALNKLSVESDEQRCRELCEALPEALIVNGGKVVRSVE